jgi:hypothetical protein
MPAEPAVCPKCSRADAVRKVTSIFSGETTTTDTRGFGLTDGEHGFKFIDVYASSTSRSRLTARLCPPGKPGSPSGNPTFYLLLMSRIGIAGVGLAFLAATLTCASTVLLFTSTAGRLLIFAVLAVFIIVFVLAVRRVISGSWRDRHRIWEEREQYPVHYERWQRAYERWQQLYYCARDDGVFLPKEARFVPIEQMEALLYSAKRKNGQGLRVKLVSPKSNP